MSAAAPKVGDTWYRYEERRYGVANEFDDLVGSYVQLELIELTVTKLTPKGVWLTRFMTPRFVLLAANKRYAQPTKQAALESILARKARQIRILESQTKQAREVTALAQRELAKLKPSGSAIPVELEDSASLAGWGIGLEKAMEQCVFCGAGTRYWHKASNKPVCQCCASIKTVDDLPKVGLPA